MSPNIDEFLRHTYITRLGNLILHEIPDLATKLDESIKMINEGIDTQSEVINKNFLNNRLKFKSVVSTTLYLAIAAVDPLSYLALPFNLFGVINRASQPDTPFWQVCRAV